MTEKVKFDDSRFFDAKRLKDLGDGIFAFAMTFLIVTIDIPKVPISMLRSVLIRIAPDIFTYVMGFFLLAIFWMTNHIQMKNIKRADSRVVWISMLLYLMIVFVPLTSDIYAFYDGSRMAMLIFNLNILLIGLTFMLQWHHLVVNSLHHEEFRKDEIKDRYMVSLVLIVVSFLAIIVGLYSPVWSAAVYLLMFMYSMYRRIRWIQKESLLKNNS